MIWLLLVVFQIKHFLADYPLQGRYMLGKFKPYPDFILPLLSHGLVHGVFTFLIALYLKPWDVALVLAVLDLAIHSTVDWIKANPSIGGRFKYFTKQEYIDHINYMADTQKKIDAIPDNGGQWNQERANLANERYEKSVEWNEKVRSNTFFWWALGADQMAHHLTHYLLIWALLP